MFLLAAHGAFGQEHLISLGVDVGIGPSLSYDYIPAPTSIDESGTIGLMFAGVYFDASYARISVSYMGNISPNFTGKTSSNVNLSYLVFEALAKMPLQIGDFKLWSGVGISYIICLLMDTDNDGVDDRPAGSAFNDFLLKIAIGAEFRLGTLITIGPSFALQYNLTPNLLNSEPARSWHTNFFFTLSLSVGFLL
jgi:hypothetical protein